MIIEVNPVMTKGSKNFAPRATDYLAIINPNKSITIRNFITGKTNSFNRGDSAEYDSFNLSYFGTITNITEKTVTIQEKNSPKRHRLHLEKFCWRNIDFNLAKAIDENSLTMMSI